MQTIEPVEESALSDYEKERGKPMPSRNHSIVQLRLGAAFLAFSDFSVCSELTLELPDGSRLTPDLCAYPRLTLDWLHDDIRMKQMPLLAVEILSPTQGIQDITDKIPLYFAHGVESVWFVNPPMQLIAIFRPGISKPQVFTEGEVKDPATGLTARVEEIFA